MIGYLAGTAVSPNVVVATGTGIGWQVHCPEALTVGEHVELWVTTIVREGDISLYGFVDGVDQALFAALTRIPKVGPKIALALLRDVGGAGIATAVAESDPKALCVAAGVGAKLADTIIAMIDLDGIDVDDDATGRADLITALGDMGFDAPAAHDAIRDAIAALGADASDSDLLLAAMATLREAA